MPVPALDRWERQQREHKRGFEQPGEKRRRYIDSLKVPTMVAKQAESLIGQPATPETMHRFANSVQQQYTRAFTQGRLPPGRYYPISIQNDIDYGGATARITLASDYYTMPTGASVYDGGTTANSIYINNTPLTIGGDIYCQPAATNTRTTFTIQAPSTALPFWTSNMNGVIISGGDTQYVTIPPETELERKRRQIKQQLAPAIINHRGDKARAENTCGFDQVTPAEMKALHLMRKMLAPDAWRRYLRHGLVVVQGKSGLTYLIYRQRSHIFVIQGNRKVAELCISVRYGEKVPPTDDVITRKIMLECDEPGVWASAGIHKLPKWGYRHQPTDADLKQLAVA